MSLTFSTTFWASTVFLIFLMMYLIHEPIHVLIAMENGVDVLEVNSVRQIPCQDRIVADFLRRALGDIVEVSFVL
jgi:hypothetical protein